MNILNTLLEKRGQFSRAVWERDCKVRSGAPLIRKKTVATIRSGISYDNIANVQEMRKSGELPSRNQGLAWGNWEIYPFLIKHRDTRYVRLYPVNGESTSKVTYLMDNNEVEFSDIEQYLKAEEKREQSRICFTVKLDDILEFS